MDTKTVIFFGMSGSGKGTQARLLERYLRENDPTQKVLYIETGARFREFVKGENYTQQKVGEVLDKGGLLPAFLPIYVWGSFLIENFTGNEHLVLDGLARRESESPILDEALKFYGRNEVDVISLKLSREVATKRLKGRGREDDIELEDIERRLDWYDEYAVPAVEFFRGRGGYRMHTIDAEQSIEVIQKDILKILSLE